MEYIGDLLNKIRWDKKVNPEEYTLLYFDRIDEKLYEVSFTAIARKGNFITILKDGKEYSVPLHRIRQVKRNGKLVWER
jgi:uncharacterized protein (UPF0248 family)